MLKLATEIAKKCTFGVRFCVLRNLSCSLRKAMIVRSSRVQETLVKE